MIKFSKDRQDVIVNIELTIGYTIELRYPRHCSMDAKLLVDQIEKDLQDKIAYIRKEAYQCGWKDAKSKKVCKKTWFNPYINSHM